jgi:hypothetical protein
LEIGFSGLEFVVGFPMDEIFPTGSERIATRFSSFFFLSLKMSTSFLVPSPKWMKKKSKG